MSAIDELVAELCPDGVEYRNLYDVAHFDRGQVITAKNTVDGGIPVVAGGQKPAYYHNVSNRPAGTITVAGSGAYAGYVSMWDTPIWLSDAFSVAPNDEHELSSAFLYQLLKLNQNWIYAKKKGSGVPHVHGADLSRLQIPVPPIEVQREIVCILDTFTALTDTLTEELNCRRQQYAYYRDRLLSLESLEALDGKPVEMKRLGNIARIFDGTHQTPKYVSSGIKFVSVENIGNLTASNKFITEEAFNKEYKNPPECGDVLMTRIGSIGSCAVVETDEPLAYYVSLSLIKPNRELIIPKFLRHAIEGRDGRRSLYRRTIHTAVPIKINLGDVGKVEIPVPSLATQQKVVDILDRFDALTTSLTDGLPAEIEARRTQYGYYRDRLLDFPRKGGVAA